MRLGDQRESSNVQDRRGIRYGRAGGIGLGTIVLALVAMYFGQDPSVVLQGVQQGPVQEQQVPYEESAQEAEARVLVSKVLADTEDTWGAIFKAGGQTYEEPQLILFSEGVQTACGFGESASGPFYCPADHKVYIDLTFYQELRDRFGAPGDFAQAYVIAHEVGHHVQTLLGISEQTQAARQRASQAEGNAISVRQELQADCFAGIWAHNANQSRQLLEAGDVEEGLNAASAIGDDRLTQGRAPPEAFTHGTSEQRVRWFKRGLDSGSMDQCDTFGAKSL
ncbi:KPN_02809 family neutral zinc metallopeptidase [Povalibacter sp.]|uniref:KPN_02809 family neutral zinc metallopeptidase n=1 Tax=Povalibacter sp. TaxID=1962978 RepID=UPI002F4281E5